MKTTTCSLWPQRKRKVGGPRRGGWPLNPASESHSLLPAGSITRVPPHTLPRTLPSGLAQSLQYRECPPGGETLTSSGLSHRAQSAPLPARERLWAASSFVPGARRLGPRTHRPSRTPQLSGGQGRDDEWAPPAGRLTKKFPEPRDFCSSYSKLEKPSFNKGKGT